MKVEIQKNGMPAVVELEKAHDMCSGNIYLNDEEELFYISGNAVKILLMMFTVMTKISIKEDKDLKDMLVGAHTAMLLDKFNNYTQVMPEQIISE